MNEAIKNSLSDEQFSSLLRFFQVFGNESRLKLIGHLANGEQSVGDLADLLGLKEPTVSHHLAEMKAIDLVTVRADGNKRYYALDAKALEGMARNIFAPANLASLVKASELSEDERILRNFVQDGRLTQIPKHGKKMTVILTWLADQIDPDTRYTEKEISQRLADFHPDFASLRRYLIEYGFMERENGVYWRVDRL